MIHKAMLSNAAAQVTETQAQQPTQKAEKRSFKNRLGESVKQGFNTRNTILKDELATTAGVAASVGAAALIKKSPTAQKAISKGVNFLKNSKLGTKAAELAKKAWNSGTAQTVKKYGSKALGWLKALPKPAKAVLALGVAVTSIVSNKIRTNGIYKAGQINQEYKDKAKIDNIL